MKNLLKLLVCIVMLSCLCFSACENKDDPVSKDESNSIFLQNSVYKITSKSSRKSLDIGGESTDNGANLSQWDYFGGSNQQWIIKEQEKGIFQIINLNSGKCLDVDGGSTENGANIMQWDCHGENNQKWTIEKLEDGSYSITNVNSLKCMDLQDSNPDNGGNIFQWECWESDNQKWLFEEIHREAPDDTDYQEGLPVDSSHLMQRAPFKIKGRFIVDNSGKRIKLLSVNWYGASDIYHVAGGLDRSTPEEIAAVIKQMGFNSVRLPFSNEMLTVTDVPEHALAANPALQGKSAMEIFDSVIDALTHEGLMVFLNNHTTTAKWCCGYDENALWFSDDFTAENWMKDWEFLIERYKSNPLVLGADLRNEPRNGENGTPQWGTNDKWDFHSTCTVLGNRIHKINPDMLIIVEGLHYSQNIKGVEHLPVKLDIPDKVIYSPHNYAFFRGSKGPFRILPYTYFKEELDSSWGYILEEGNDYTAPLWLSEFGIGQYDQNYGEYWFSNIIRYLKEKDIDWAWWSLNAGFKPGTDDYERYGLLTEDWKNPLDDWRVKKLKYIMKVKIQ